MKRAILLTAIGMTLATMPATAQTPRTNYWDISKVDVSKLPPASDKQNVTFDKDIEPILKASCVGCHGPRRARHSFRLDTLSGALAGGDEGKMVVPGNSQDSLLVVAAARINDHISMPPKPRNRNGGPGGGPGGSGGPGGPPPGGGPDNGGPPPGGGPPAGGGPDNGGPPPGQGGGDGRGPGRFPPPKPLSAEQVGLLRAWIDQGAK